MQNLEKSGRREKKKKMQKRAGERNNKLPKEEEEMEDQWKLSSWQESETAERKGISEKSPTVTLS